MLDVPEGESINKKWILSVPWFWIFSPQICEGANLSYLSHSVCESFENQYIQLDPTVISPKPQVRLSKYSPKVQEDR